MFLVKREECYDMCDEAPKKANTGTNVTDGKWVWVKKGDSKIPKIKDIISKN